jgi:F-type H+-transporting ATPase subunit a
MLALPPLAPETIFHVGDLAVTNTYINATITMVAFVLVAFFVGRMAKHTNTLTKAPTGLLNFFETVLEQMLVYADQVTRDRKRSIQFLPLVGSLFLFILVSNWIGLLPGVGSIGRYLVHEGHLELIPLFRPAATDLNVTLSMAVLAVVSSHIFGIAAIGLFRYANKFIKLGDVWSAIVSLSPQKILVAAIEFIVGIIEVFSEVAKMVSLSLRLFGNVFAGEVLLTVLVSLIPFVVPLPFLLLETLVGFVQAMVFAMLTLVYLTVATTPLAEHNTHAHAPSPSHS